MGRSNGEFGEYPRWVIRHGLHWKNRVNGNQREEAVNSAHGPFKNRIDSMTFRRKGIAGITLYYGMIKWLYLAQAVSLYGVLVL